MKRTTSILQRPHVAMDVIEPSTGKVISVSAIVDTGASITCIPAELLHSFGKAYTYTVMRTRFPTGETRNLRALYLTLRFADVEIEDHKVLLVPNLPEPVLGWDVLSNAEMLAAAVLPLFGSLSQMIAHVPLFKKKFVLVLGQDTTEFGRLRCIQSHLGKLNYEGIVLKDLSDVRLQCLEEKVNMLGSLCRFVVCENTTPSGHIAELSICARNRFVTAVVQQSGRGATRMQADYPLDYAFMSMFEYSDMAGIPECVDRAVEWANKKVVERADYLDSIYQWRRARTGR